MDDALSSSAPDLPPVATSKHCAHETIQPSELAAGTTNQASVTLLLSTTARCSAAPSLVPHTQVTVPVAVLKSVHKSYQMDSVRVPVLFGIDAIVRPGLFTVLLGPSGSGKTTLLNLVGCIDLPDAGEVHVAGQAVHAMNDDALADFRAANVGFVFQNFNLVPVLSAYENIEYPLLSSKYGAVERHRRVTKLLEAVGLADRGRNLPGQLSGGQRQRVAIARALVRRPQLVICDEPTANLDSQTGAAILRLMRYMQRRYRISFLFSSHDPSLIKEADDLIVLRDGVIQKIVRTSHNIHAGENLSKQHDTKSGMEEDESEDVTSTSGQRAQDEPGIGVLP